MRIFIFLVLSLSLSISAMAQAPQAFSYQGVVRNADGSPLAEQDAIVRIGILANSVDGVLVWEEEHAVLTDAFGLFNLNVGEGNSTGNGNLPAFSFVNWGATSYFLKVEIDAGLGSFELLGTTQLLSVPYALFAANVGDAVITDFSFENDSLIIDEAGEEWILDIGSVLEEALVGESINLVQIVDDQLNIVEGDDAFNVDLSPYLDDEDWVVQDNGTYTTGVNVGVGTSNPTSTFHSAGSMALGFTSLIGPVNIELDDTHHVVLGNVTSGEINVTLPQASTCPGRTYVIKRLGEQPLSFELNILTAASDTIDGESSFVLGGFLGLIVELISDGSNWYILRYSSL